MKPLNFLIMFFLIPWIARAQEPTSLSLEEAVQYALEHQVIVQNALIDQEIAQAQVGETRAQGLPQINGTGSLVYNPQLKRGFTKYNTLSPLSKLAANPNLQNGDAFSYPNIFQLQSSGDFSATINQLIFDGSYFVGLKAAKTYTELAKKNTTSSKINTVEAVKKAYYLALVNEERLNYVNANIARVDTTLRQTQVQHQQGFVEKIDVDRLEVTYNNLINERAKVDNLLEISHILLKYQMGMPIDSSINLSENLASVQLDTTIHDGSVNVNNRVDYQILQTNKTLQHLNLKNYRAGYLPKLSFFATGGYFAQNNTVQLLMKNKFYNYSLYGLNLNVPIFDGFAKAYRVKQAKLELKKTEKSIQNLENMIVYQVEQSQYNLENALKSLNSQKRNLDLAREVIRVTKIKYQEGVGTNLELVTAETSYREAQTNYYNALYDAIVAKIDYEKSTGTLYNE